MIRSVRRRWSVGKNFLKGPEVSLAPVESEVLGKCEKACQRMLCLLFGNTRQTIFEGFEFFMHQTLMR